jgi:hypothetical protein
MFFNERFSHIVADITSDICHPLELPTKHKAEIILKEIKDKISALDIAALNTEPGILENIKRIIDDAKVIRCGVGWGIFVEEGEEQHCYPITRLEYIDNKGLRKAPNENSLYFVINNFIQLTFIENINFKYHPGFVGQVDIEIKEGYYRIPFKIYIPGEITINIFASPDSRVIIDMEGYRGETYDDSRVMELFFDVEKDSKLFNMSSIDIGHGLKLLKGQKDE